MAVRCQTQRVPCLLLLGMASLMFLFVNILGGGISPAFKYGWITQKLNSPYFIQLTIGAAVSLLITFVAASFAAMGASSRDYRYQSYQVTFTYPVPERVYIWGKFSGIWRVQSAAVYHRPPGGSCPRLRNALAGAERTPPVSFHCLLAYLRADDSRQPVFP